MKLKSYFIIVLLLVLMSCSQSKEVSESIQQSEELQTSLITMEDRTFSIDDFISIGWKKNKQLDNGEFDNTESIWYGFFDKKDVEVWLYNSHDNALTNGAPYAEKTVNKRQVQFGQTKGTQIRYNSYAIAGNAMILCENNLDECKALVSVLE